MNTDSVCYTGTGALKSGNHTKQEYLDIMNKHFKKECAVYIKSLKCKACKKSKEMSTKEFKKQLQAQLKHRTYTISKKKEREIVAQMAKCKRCKNNKTKKCDFNKYILFSGANPGKCGSN